MCAAPAAALPGQNGQNDQPTTPAPTTTGASDQPAWVRDAGVISDGLQATQSVQERLYSGQPITPTDGLRYAETLITNIDGVEGIFNRGGVNRGGGTRRVPGGPAGPGVEPPGGFVWNPQMAIIAEAALRAPASVRRDGILGTYYAYGGQHNLAVPFLVNALEADPRNWRVASTLSNSAYQAQDMELARAAAGIALRVNPQDQVAFAVSKLAEGRASKFSFNTSLTQRPAGMAPEAAPSGAETVSAPNAAGFAAPAPGGSVAVGAGGAPSVLPQRTPEQVAADAAKLAGLTPVQASAQATENARQALLLKDYPLAVAHASKAIEFNDKNAQALNYRAIAYNHQQNYADAVADASAALALAPGSGAALQTRSWAFSQQKRYREGLQDAEATLLTDPKNAYAYQNKAFALAGMGDRAAALDALRLSASLDARFQGQYERALQIPKDQDLTLLFQDTGSTVAPAAKVAAPVNTKRRFLRMAVLSGTGGLLIALGILHVVSASWREKVRLTVRRVLAASDEVAAEAAPAHSGATAFWTQYDLVKEIGMGGMGVVYEATDRSLERRVAVKKMRDEIRIDPHERSRFVNEAKVVAALRHPNIVDIYAIVEDGADVYLVFEFVEGQTLHDRLRSAGAYSFGEGLKVFRDICGAVDHAHAAKVIHRDLKPSNVMVTPEGRVKVMDFGVARQAKDMLTKVSMTNTVVGTPPYMAPEQEQGTVRKESDVYALAVCFYEMLTGQLPFTGAGSGMLLNKINGKHIPPSQRVPSLPAKLDGVMAKALNPDPEKRHHTAAELLADLEKLA